MQITRKNKADFQGKAQFTHAISRIIQMLELRGKNFEAAIINMHHDVKGGKSTSNE